MVKNIIIYYIDVRIFLLVPRYSGVLVAFSENVERATIFRNSENVAVHENWTPVLKRWVEGFNILPHLSHISISKNNLFS